MFNKTRTRRTAVGLAMVTLLGIGGGLLGGATFAEGMVHDQLVAQKINFPPKGPGLDPGQYPGLQRYAGQQVDDGPKAKAFADQFIASHLENIADGKTYSEVSTASRANPDDRRLAGQRQALFEGETLRGLLLSAWGWSVVAQITFVAAYAAFAAAGVLLLGTGIALARTAQADRATDRVGRPVPAGATADLATAGVPV